MRDVSQVAQLSGEPPWFIRLLLQIQDDGGSREVPTGRDNRDNYSLRFHMKWAVKKGIGVIENGEFKLIQKIVSPGFCLCGERLHVTSTGAHCPKCRNGIRPLSESERMLTIEFGATFSESLVDCDAKSH